MFFDNWLKSERKKGLEESFTGLGAVLRTQDEKQWLSNDAIVREQRIILKPCP